MNPLMSLSGTGQLINEGKDIGSVDYEIRVYRVRGFKEGRGTIKADPSFLQRTLPKENDEKGTVRSPASASLRLEDGKNIEIHLEDLGTLLRYGKISFVTIGEIPGF